MPKLLDSSFGLHLRAVFLLKGPSVTKQTSNNDHEHILEWDIYSTSNGSRLADNFINNSFHHVS